MFYRPPLGPMLGPTGGFFLVGVPIGPIGPLGGIGVPLFGGTTTFVPLGMGLRGPDGIGGPSVVPVNNFQKSGVPYISCDSCLGVLPLPSTTFVATAGLAGVTRTLSSTYCIRWTTASCRIRTLTPPTTSLMTFDVPHVMF